MRLFLAPTIIICFLSSGCAVVFPTMQATCPVAVDNQDVTAAIVVALQQYGFSATVVSPNIGMVVSDWKVLTTPGQEIAASVFSAAFLGAYNAETYRERMQLTFTVNRQNQTLTVRPHKQQVSRSLGWSDDALDNGDVILIQNVVTTAVSTMGGSIASIQWVYPPGQEP